MQRLNLTELELVEEQKRLEEESRKVSIERFHKDHEAAADRHRFGETLVGRRVIETLVEQFAGALDEWMSTPQMVRSPSHKMLTQINDNKAVAFIYIKAILNIIPIKMHSSGRNGQKLFGAKRNQFLLQSTEMIHDEVRLRFFQENYPKIMKTVIKNANRRALTRQRKRELFQKEFRYLQLEWRDPLWTQTNRVHLGMRLLDIFIKLTGMLRLETIKTGHKKTESMIFLTEEFQEFIQKFMSNNEYVKPLYSPMVVPPRKWSNETLVSSGYLTENIPPYKMIKRAKVPYLRDLELTDLSTVIGALNAIQETPWRVNETVLEALDWVYEKNLMIDAVPPSKDLELPPKPPHMEKGDEVWKENMAQCALVYRQNRKSISKRIAFLSLMSIAKRYAKYERIYFPHDMDSRGRMYPKPTFLNPQGPSHVKALLEFAEGKPVETIEDVNYLAIAGANAYGLDKLPLKERIEWAFQNEEMFESIATDWKADTRWTEADSPFEFLRFCVEWKMLGDHGPGFVSHMPVNFDATCSGLQHFSAILKDAVGGFNVNLTACPERQDIYQAVASKAEEEIKKDLNDPELAGLAQVALTAGVTRALAKRPVMIVPYSGTFKACMNYVELYYAEGYETGKIKFSGFSEEDISIRLVPYVSRHIWDAIGNTVIAARQAMNWIKVISREIAHGSKKNKPILWTTPAGLTVSQFTTKSTQKEVGTRIDGFIKIKIREETQELDPRKTASSISPNYIHSMDAAHLQLTVVRALESGRNMSFSMIHDSFGVHAADMKYFVEECIKPCFYEMYRDGKALNRFYEEVKGQLDCVDNIPPIPPLGDLDITEVLDSEFFFS